MCLLCLLCLRAPQACGARGALGKRAGGARHIKDLVAQLPSLGIHGRGSPGDAGEPVKLFPPLHQRAVQPGEQQ